VQSFQGVPAISYFLQVSTNLAAPAFWETIATNLGGPDGLSHFIDPEATNALTRFYRTLTP